jgi:hypothetical protein
MGESRHCSALARRSADSNVVALGLHYRAATKGENVAVHTQRSGRVLFNGGPQPAPRSTTGRKVLAVIGVVAFFAAVVALVLTLNHYSDRAMNNMDEAKSGSHKFGWVAVWIGLAAASALVVLFGMATANRAGQSYAPPTPTPWTR